MASSIATLIDDLCAQDNGNEDDAMATTTTVQTQTTANGSQRQHPATVDTYLYYLPDDREVKELHLGTASMRLEKFKPVPMTVKDIRTCDEDFTLEKNGFQAVKHEISVKDLERQSDPRIPEVVYGETEELVKALTGATHTIVISHLIRKSSLRDILDAAEMAEDSSKVLPPGPATHIHVDQSFDGAITFLEDTLPEAEAAQLQKTRWGIINVWRPLKRPVTRDALAVCDYTTISTSQLRPVMMYTPVDDGGNFSSALKSENRGFESWRLKYSGEPNQWYYCSAMTPDEALVFKCFDSKVDGRARFAAHSAIQTKDDRGPARMSLEIRLLVFWEDQEAE